MPSLIDLRRRIRSVKNTEQITKAMKMVSAAKLRRAQQAVVQSRPYARLLGDILSSVLGQASGDAEQLGHPLLARRPERKALFLLLSGDKGLAGAFNANILKEARRFLQEKDAAGVETHLELIGKKGRDFYARRSYPIAGEWVNVFSRVELLTAQQIAKRAIDSYSEARYDAVYVLYSEFKSAMTQTPVLRRVLPVEPASDEGPATDYLFAQPPAEMFRTLLPKYVESQVYQAMLESSASEHAARMAAMEAATRNAGEVIEKLTLHLNRVRQASITTEIIEIVSGAAALE